MIVFANVSRLLFVTSRIESTLLMSVAAKTLKIGDGANSGDNENDEYKDLFELIVVQDRDTLPSHDPRITYVIDIVSENERFLTLEGAERDRQKRPRSKRFPSNDSGKCMIYRLCTLLRIDRVISKPIKMSMVSRLLPPQSRQTFSRSLRSRHRSQADIGSLANLDSDLGAANVSLVQRHCVIDTLMSISAPIAQLMTSTSDFPLARPSSIRRLSGIELAALWRYLTDARVDDVLDMAIANAGGNGSGVVDIPGVPDWLKTMCVGRFADCMPLAVSKTRRRLLTAITEQRKWRDLYGSDAVDGLVASMRLYGSTVGTLHETFDMDRDISGVLKQLNQIGALRQVGETEPQANDDDTAGSGDSGAGIGSGGVRPLFSTARDDELERELAHLLHDDRLIDEIIVLSAAGNPSEIYGRALLARLRTLGVVQPLDHRVQVVAPTVGHALAVRSVDALSVDDVLAGDIDTSLTTDSLIIVFAHCFGLDSLVHTVRFFTHGRNASASASASSSSSVAASENQRPLRHLVLVGDPFNSNGSPRESDRGAPLRDVAAALRRGCFGARARYDTLFGMSGAAAMGPLSGEDHDLLRRRESPMMPDNEDTYDVHTTMDDVPMDVRDCGLVLVGIASLSEALKQVGSFRDALAINRYISFDELGQVARVRSAFRSTYVPSMRTTPMMASGHQIEQFIPLARSNVYVELEYTRRQVGGGGGSQNFIDHRRCCATAMPNLACVAMHAVSRALAGAPARLIARVAPAPVADELAFVITERTGIEDVRAAFSLVRRRLHLVAPNGPADVRRALKQHAPRPRTRLVDLLLAADAASHRPVHVPMTLLEYSGRYEMGALLLPPQQQRQQQQQQQQQQQKKKSDTTRIMVLGTTSSSDVFDQTSGTVDEYSLISVDRMRRHLFSYLSGDDKKDDEGGCFSGGDAAAAAVAATTTIDEAEESDNDLLRPRLGVKAAEEGNSKSSQPLPIFSSEHVDVTALATIDYRRVDLNIKQRLWALIHSYRIGTLGNDVDDDELAEAAGNYPPPIDVWLRQAFISGTRALRAREATIVHMMCKIVKNVAETWYIEAERKMVRSRPGIDEEAANRHAMAIRTHLDAISEPPALREAPEDAFSLYEKLHNLRDYLRERQSAAPVSKVASAKKQKCE